MNPKALGLAVLSAMALMVSASTASATTLEIGGVAKNAEVALETTIGSGGSFLETDTSNFSANTCTSSAIKGHTESPFTGTTVGGPITTLSWTNCTEGNPTVDKAGVFSVERIGTTTNGTVRWTGSTITTPSFFGTFECTTNNTDIGTITGVASGSAIFHVNAVVSCTLIGSAKWSGTYTVTSPAGLGVTG
jgi:hypothetical protein